MFNLYQLILRLPCKHNVHILLYQYIRDSWCLFFFGFSYNLGKSIMSLASWSTEGSISRLSKNQKSCEHHFLSLFFYWNNLYFYNTEHILMHRNSNQVVIARQFYFNYTTPDRSRQEMLRTMTPRPTDHWPFLRHESITICLCFLLRIVETYSKTLNLKFLLHFL